MSKIKNVRRAESYPDEQTGLVIMDTSKRKTQ